MTPYQIFNYLEGTIWFLIAVALPFKFPANSKTRKIGLLIAGIGFMAFAVSDFLEAPRQAAIPLWLWGLKIGCGILLLSGRYTYLGWRNFSPEDRFFRLGLVLLMVVGLLIGLQSYLEE